MANYPKNPGWGIEGYTRRELLKRAPSELRKEYQRVKSMAVKRGKRIAASAYGAKHPMAQRLLNLPSSKGMTDAQIVSALHEAGNLVLQKTASVSGLDAAYAASYETIYGKKPSGSFSGKGKKRGKEADELKAFGEWMEAYRAKVGEKENGQGSDIAAQTYHDMVDAGIDAHRVRANVEKWVELNAQADRQGKMFIDFAENAPRTKGGRISGSAEAWRKAMKIRG